MEIKMPTNVTIDDKLIEEAQIGNHRTKKAAVIEALLEYIQRRKQLKIIDLFGSIDMNLIMIIRSNGLNDDNNSRNKYMVFSISEKK